MDNAEYYTALLRGIVLGVLLYAIAQMFVRAIVWDEMWKREKSRFTPPLAD